MFRPVPTPLQSNAAPLLSTGGVRLLARTAAGPRKGKLGSWGAGLALLAAAAGSSPSAAIIRRHDVPDTAYQDYGRRFRGPVVSLGIPDKTGAPRLYNGMGVLIAPQWVLTAAHAADVITPGGPLNPFSRYSVYVGGVPHLIDAAFINPTWKGKNAGEDIALIRLKEPVTDVAPVALYSERDELNRTATVAGFGLPGTGVSGVGKPDSIFRAAQVTISHATPRVLGWTFRGPTMAGVLPLEGISGPGDSGGPAFIATNGKLYVAGISSTQERGGRPEGTYGVKEYYARVSYYKQWIEKVMQENTPSCQCPATAKE